MERSNCISPRVGLATVVTVAIWMIGLGSLSTEQPTWILTEFESETAIRSLAIGLYYGILAWFCWVLTVVPSRIARLCLRVTAAMVGSYVIQLRIYDPINLDPSYVIRYAINFGGMMISQVVLFLVLKIPSWRLSGANSGRVVERFSIGDMLIFTTCVAVMFGLGIRYQPPIDRLLYWPWLIGIWIVFPIVSAGVCVAVLARHWSRGLVAAIGALALIAVSSVILGKQDARMFAPLMPNLGWRVPTMYYALISVGNLLVLGSFGLSGRIDAGIERREMEDSGVNSEKIGEQPGTSESDGPALSVVRSEELSTGSSAGDAKIDPSDANNR